MHQPDPVEDATEDLQPISPALMRATAWRLTSAALLFLAGWLAPAEFSLRVGALAGSGSLHALMETFTIVIAMLIFGVTWNAYSSERSGNLLVLAGGFLAVGLINLAHMLSSVGMPDFVTPAGYEKANYFDFAARLVAAGVLLAITLRQWKPVASLTARYRLLATSIAITGLVYWIGLYHADQLPRAFVPDTGITPFNVASEYFIIAVLVAAGSLLLRHARRRGSVAALHLFAACFIFVLSCLCLTLKSDASDLFYVLENIYKIAAFALVYQAVFVQTVSKPFERLSRARADLARANEEVRRVNIGLEQRVAERTAGLDQANSSLRDGVTRIQSILDTAADGILSIDSHGIVKSFNRAAERIFGYLAVEVIGQNVTILMPEAYRSVHDRHLEHYRAAGQTPVSGRMTEVMARRKDGSIFPMEMSISEMRLGDERHFTLIGRDITERRAASEQLRKLSLAVEQSPESILITDLEGRIEYVNSGFLRATGYTCEELIGKNPRVLQSGNTPPETYVAMWDALLAGRSWKGELYNRRKDGSEYVESATITPLQQPGGAISHYVGVKQDITEAKRLGAELACHRHHLEELVESRTQELSAARQQADDANRAKSNFLATMSHEIRTPLGGLIGMLELLSMSPLADQDRETLQAAHESGRSLLRILNDVLDWSKISEGKLELAPQATSVAGILADVANTYMHVASSKGVTLAQQVDARLNPMLMVDPLRLSQVLNNFVSNAIKFSRVGGRVELRAELIGRREGAEEVRLSVKDTGIGIDAATRTRLFERYGQASADTARMYGGTGLGLAICRRLADLMDGRIDVDSKPGRGSTFSITLTLPLARTGAQPPRDRPTIAAAASAWPLVNGAAATDAPLVLVVDDHPVNRALLARQLGLLGLRAETAEDGKEALALWRAGHYALVITDCHMPQLDGYELAHVIRGIEVDQARARTPIFGWTANALSDEIGICAAAGMDEVLIKPADLAQLKQLLEKWLPAAAQPAPDQPKTPPVPQAVAASQPLDLTLLTTICDGDRAAVREKLLEFRRVNDQDAVQLRQAVMHDDLQRVAVASHRISGSSSIVGAKELARACRHIDHASRAGDSETVAEGMQVLEREIQRLNACIDSFCADAVKE